MEYLGDKVDLDIACPWCGTEEEHYGVYLNTTEMECDHCGKMFDVGFYADKIIVNTSK